jgi:hypothetical protein
MPKIMQAVDLVEAVTDLTQARDRPVAKGKEIEDWCTQRGIYTGADLKPRNPHFWDADLEAGNDLRKFKKEASSGLMTDQTSDNGWCLIERWADACEWASTQSPE